MKYGKLTSVLCASLILLGAAALPLAAQNTFTAAEANVSWYGEEFQGRPTSSGELFDMNAFTAAHKTLPFGTLLEVTNLENGRKVIVRINDRGPFVADRELDISKAAAEVLDIVESGTGRVSIREVSESEAVALVSAADAPETEAPADEPEVTVPAPVIAAAPVAPIVPVTPVPAITAAPETPVLAEPALSAPEVAVAPAPVAPAPVPTPAPAPAVAVVPATPAPVAPAPVVPATPAPVVAAAPAPVAPVAVAPVAAIAPAPVAAAPVRPAAPAQKPAPAVQAAPPAPIVVYTAPAPVKGIGWRIQLGSFTREENATRLVIKLRKAGFNPAFEKADSMTRVVIAGIPDAELAATKEKLRLAGYADYLVRQESW
jgi:rare lipoprotein A